MSNNQIQVEPLSLVKLILNKIEEKQCIEQESLITTLRIENPDYYKLKIENVIRELIFDNKINRIDIPNEGFMLCIS